MIDLKKNKVYLIDFAGNGTFNPKTASFYPNELSPYISIVDLYTILTFLPRPEILEKRQILNIEYQQLYTFLKEIKDTSERHKTSPFYFNIKINDIKERLIAFLQSF